MQRRNLWPVVAFVALAPAMARATYSICATDMATMQVGGSGATCLTTSVHIIYGTAPGHGVVHAQAQYNEAGKLEAVDRLNLDELPADIITAITAPAFDPAASLRQYGIADLMGRTAGYTGAFTTAYAEDRQGLVDTFPYSVQGNILTSVAVIDQAEAAFVNGGGCDLADRLMLALEAGANGGEGDSRCTPDGIPSSSAFIEVDREGEPAESYLFLEVVDTAPANPLPLLRQQYDMWRMSNPCPLMPDGGMPDLGSDGPVLPDAGVDSMPDLPVPDSGAAPDVGGPPDATPVVDAGPASDSGPPPVDAAADAAAPADGGVPVDAPWEARPDAPIDGTTGPDAPERDARDSYGGDDGSADTQVAGGCACRAGASRAGAWLLLPLLWSWRRRRPRA